jgi:hypothetical protein
MSDYYPDHDDSVPAQILQALAEHREGAPYTAAELAGLIEDGEQPEREVTKLAAYLYQKHAVDRRKRDEPMNPYEYWLAGRGRYIAQQEGWLPAQDDTGLPDPAALAVQVGTAEDVEEPVVEDLGGLNAALAGIADTLSQHDDLLETLKGDAVMDEELAQLREDVNDQLRNSVQREVLEDVEALREQVHALGETVQQQTNGEADAYARPIRELRRLEDEGYHVHEVERNESFAGRVVEVRVRAEKEGEKDRRIEEQEGAADG